MLGGAGWVGDRSGCRMFVASTVAGVSGCPMKLPPAGTGAAEPG